MSDGALMVVVSLAAGVIGTGLGGFIGVFLSRTDGDVLARVMGFAGGMMLGVACIEMLPSARDALTRFTAEETVGIIAASVRGGAALVRVFGKLSERRAQQVGGSHSLDDDKSPVAAVLLAAREKGDRRSSRLISTGLAMAAAIGLHNFPEGLAIGAAGSVELAGGITVALAIALHNIPEGMAVSAPLAGGGVRKSVAFVVSVLAGAVTPVGAGVGVLLGGVSQEASAVCLSVAAGAMLCVTFTEVFAEAYRTEGTPPYIYIIAGAVSALAFSFV